MRRLCRTLCHCLIVWSVSSALAQEVSQEAATRAQIQSLRDEISVIEARIAQRETEKNTLQQTLRRVEEDIGQLDKQSEALQRTLSESRAAIRTLQQQQATLEDKRDHHEKQLVVDIRNLWSMGQGDGLQVLFGDQSPHQMALNLTYFRYLSEHRYDLINQYQDVIRALHSNLTAQEAAQSVLEAQQVALARQREALASAIAQRQITLVALGQEQVADEIRIDALRADLARLADLLEALRETLADLETPAFYKPFADAKGELAAPIPGRPSNRFGAARGQSDMRWGGWLIPSEEGTPVRAVHHGRVVYADWLRGQGLLLIIDHGGGWLTLYSHNRSLRREVGDWVQPGDAIATVGASGGADQPALYFEIRKDGEPVDPQRWIKR
jgi:septal ring factor EnvC (AmiA/AmiB activator)